MDNKITNAITVDGPLWIINPSHRPGLGNLFVRGDIVVILILVCAFLIFLCMCVARVYQLQARNREADAVAKLRALEEGMAHEPRRWRRSPYHHTSGPHEQTEASSASAGAAPAYTSGYANCTGGGNHVIVDAPPRYSPLSDLFTRSGDEGGVRGASTAPVNSSRNGIVNNPYDSVFNNGDSNSAIVTSSTRRSTEPWGTRFEGCHELQNLSGKVQEQQQEEQERFEDVAIGQQQQQIPPGHAPAYRSPRDKLLDILRAKKPRRTLGSQTAK